MRSRDRLLSTSINVIDVIAEEYFFAIQNLIISSLCSTFFNYHLPKITFLSIYLKALFGLIIYLILILLNALIFSISGLISADIFQLIPVVLQLSISYVTNTLL